MKTPLLVLATSLSLWPALACDSAHDADSGSDPVAMGPAPAGSLAPAMPQAGAPAEPMNPAQPMNPTQPMKMQPTNPAEPYMPFAPDAKLFAWSTGKFMLAPGQERYLCFASSLPEGLVINGYSSDQAAFVHHMIFSRTSSPETDGFEECDVAFKTSWEPLFITGTGRNALEFPSDAGHDLPRGTQLVVQLHLLNVADTAVEGSVTINMRRSEVANPRPVSSYIFGTAAVSLPPGKTTQVVGTCPLWQPVKLIAGFPHMHTLGRSMRFEVGSAGGAMKEVFKRDPFDFDNQRIDKLDLALAAGDTTRVTCSFDNPKDQTVGYGESTNNEMCYFVGFAVDLPRQSACLEVLPPDIFGN